MPDAVVIGAGPNGLVAANQLADAGWEVLVLEAEDEPGGAVRSAELLEPGFVSDLFSSFYPLAAASPAFRRLELERFGLEWRHAPLVLAHPAADGSCVALSRDLDETARSLDAFAPGDGDAWRALYALWRRVGAPVMDAVVTPFPPVLAGLRLVATLRIAGALEFARLALVPVRRLAEERFAGAGGRRLLTGNALHGDFTPDSALSGFFGWLLTALGQDVGFPCPRGGSGSLTAALVRRLEARKGTLVTGVRVDRIAIERGRAVGVRAGRDTFPARVVLADVDAPTLYLELVGEEHLPGRVRDAIRRFDWDAPIVKLDWTLDRPVPWEAEEARGASVVHLGGLDEPLVLFGQYAAADPSRCPAGKEVAWAYLHVSRDADPDRVAEEVEERVERVAPGFRSVVRRRHVMGPAELERRNSNLRGGAIMSGTTQLHQQLVFRPIPGLGRPETPVKGLYLASASAHPGGGVHGGPGAIAARAALRRERLRSFRG